MSNPVSCSARNCLGGPIGRPTEGSVIHAPIAPGTHHGVDLDFATALITFQSQQYDGHLTLCPPKTARGERAIALDPAAVAVMSTRPAERAVLGGHCQDSGYVFNCLNGDPMASDRLSRTFRTRRSDSRIALGLPRPISAHTSLHKKKSWGMKTQVRPDEPPAT